MTHRPDRIANALDLALQGVSPSAIARRIGVPRSTVRDWLDGRVPRIARTDRGGCDRCSGPSHEFELLDGQYVYLLGLYLGDGCVSRHPRDVYKLRITLDVAYPSIVDACRRSMAYVLPGRQATALARKAGCVEVYSYWKGWPCLLPQAAPGKKHARSIRLVEWQQAVVDRFPRDMLRGLIHSDGCRFMNTGTNWRAPRYSFVNHSDDIRRIFCESCDRLELRWTQCPNTIYVSRQADVARLDEFVGPKA